MKEKREQKRLAIKVPVKWRSKGHAERKLAEGFILDTRNLTEGGLFLKTSFSVKEGTRVSLELIPKKNAKPIVLYGKVMWTAQKDRHSYLYPGVGIKFDRVPRKQRKRLVDFIDHKYKIFREAQELKNMYLKLKDMASRLVELEERHASATHFKKALDNAIVEIDNVAHILDREINEIKRL